MKIENLEKIKARNEIEKFVEQFAEHVTEQIRKGNIQLPSSQKEWDKLEAECKAILDACIRKSRKEGE